MANNDFFDYSTAAGSVTDVGGTDITGATGKLKDGDNTIRELAAQSKRYVSDMAAVNTVGGTGDAVTLTSARTIAALATGIMLRFIAGAANTTAATLTVNALAAKAIRKISGGTDVALVAGDLAAGETYTVVYRSAANSAAGAWVLVGSAAVPFATVTEAATLASAVKAVNPAGLVFLAGYTSTATAAGTTTLTVTDNYNQYFTGSTTQTVALPVTSTLVLGRSFRIVNNSTGVVTINSSGGNAVYVLAPNEAVLVTCILTSGTTAASWATAPMASGLGYTCRAWVNFNGTGTVAIRASGNVSSITDNGTGDWTMNLTTALADANYCVQVTTGNGGASGPICGVDTTTTPTASLVRVLAANDAGTRADQSLVYVAIFR